MRRLAACLIALLAGSAQAQAIENAACLKPPYRAAENPAQRAILGLVTDLRAGLTGFPSLSETLEGGGVPICLSDRIAGASGYFAPENAIVVLDASLSPAMQEVVLLHELRHLDQTVRSACPDPSLSRESYAQAVMAMEADASAITALVTWTWREAGRTGPWEAFAAWPSRSDIAARLDAEMSAGAPNEHAVAAAFRQWYANPERRDSYWRSACSAYLDRQDQDHALPKYGRLAPAFWADLCEMPDGREYACDVRD